MNQSLKPYVLSPFSVKTELNELPKHHLPASSHRRVTLPGASDLVAPSFRFRAQEGAGKRVLVAYFCLGM